MTRYCPHGDGAFDDWVASCPECGSSLVDTPPDPDDIALEAERSTPTLLVSAPNEIEANLIAGILRDEGIPVMLRPGGPGFGAWASVMSFEHGVYVREVDLALAREILDETVVDENPAPEET
ncbi:MAG TPA: DUF2007 domain-containing protein [Thermomicrobiales bacterium]|jgi:hypothetical protein|nr:DUF2007 domain-containing protein [Thermomicrobiales bacterium]